MTKVERELLPDQQCVMLKVVLGVTHEVTKPDSFGVGCHNPSACKQSPMNARLAFGYMMPFTALDTQKLFQQTSLCLL